MAVLLASRNRFQAIAISVAALGIAVHCAVSCSLNRGIAVIVAAVVAVKGACGKCLVAIACPVAAIRSRLGCAKIAKSCTICNTYRITITKVANTWAI
jgi:hypothetical protein